MRPKEGHHIHNHAPQRGAPHASQRGTGLPTCQQAKATFKAPNQTTTTLGASELSIGSDQKHHPLQKLILAMILQAVLVACFATVALGTICCSPDQWEGYQFTYGEFVQKSGKLLAGLPLIKTGRYQVSYDATAQKVASFGNYTRNGQVITFKAINDYQKGRGYFILPQEKICTAFPLTNKFQAACVPDTAEDLGPFAFGLGENTLALQGYQVRSKKNGDDVTNIVSVTQQGCIPVVENMYGTIRGATFFSNVGFNDMTAGIRNPSVFLPPDYCEEPRFSLAAS